MLRVLLTVLAVCLFTICGAANAEARDDARVDTQRAIPAKPAVAPKRAPATPKLTTPQKAQRSAACCSKKGGTPCEGKSVCGIGCSVVDKMSQCVNSNFSFECPSGKGLTCFNGVCSCE